MPRTAAEATRFTATRPHVHSHSSITSSTIDLAGPPPPNETPAQKVTRLREAARRAKLGQESRWDRVVSRGKVVADVAHKTVTGGLILASVAATGFAAFSFASMALENRRKKKEWYAEQQANYEQALQVALRAEETGDITPALKLVLNKQRALDQAEAEKAAQPGLLAGIRKRVFGGLAYEEGGGGGKAVAAAHVDAGAGPPGTLPRRVEWAKEHEKMTRETAPEFTVGSDGPVMPGVAHDSRLVEGREAARRRGGPLDRLGEQTASSLAASSRSWFDWVARR